MLSSWLSRHFLEKNLRHKRHKCMSNCEWKMWNTHKSESDQCIQSKNESELQITEIAFFSVTFSRKTYSGISRSQTCKLRDHKAQSPQCSRFQVINSMTKTEIKALIKEINDRRSITWSKKKERSAKTNRCVDSVTVLTFPRLNFLLLAICCEESVSG